MARSRAQEPAVHDPRLSASAVQSASNGAAGRSAAIRPRRAMPEVGERRELGAKELDLSVDPRVGAMAEAIAAKYGAASRAVLFYGSCLRERQLEGQMLDFYLVVAHYREGYGSRWLAA